MLGCSDVIFQKCFPNQGTKFYPDDPTELGFVLQRKYEVVKLFAFQADVLLHVHLVINLVFGGILHCVSKKGPNFETVLLEIIWIDFDDIWQKYSKVSRIEFACFSFHVGLIFYQLFFFQIGHQK